MFWTIQRCAYLAGMQVRMAKLGICHMCPLSYLHNLFAKSTSSMALLEVRAASISCSEAIGVIRITRIDACRRTE